MNQLATFFDNLGGGHTLASVIPSGMGFKAAQRSDCETNCCEADCDCNTDCNSDCDCTSPDCKVDCQCDCSDCNATPDFGDGD